MEGFYKYDKKWSNIGNFVSQIFNINPLSE